jgi:ribosomal protein L37AE/L43A
MTTAVSAITCPKCKWTIFSRAHHDMHSCECGGVSIDGGFDYARVLWHGDLSSPKVFKIIV